MPPNLSKARYKRAALSGVGRTHRSMSPVAVIGHTIWIRSAGVIAAQASGSLSPRLPTHSAAVVARTVSPPRSCPEDSCGEDDIENDYTLRAKSMRKELRPLLSSSHYFFPLGMSKSRRLLEFGSMTAVSGELGLSYDRFFCMS